MIFILLMSTFLLPTGLSCYFENYRAHNAYQQGDILKAQELFDEMLTEEPNNFEVAYNLGKVALKNKQFEKANAYFMKVTHTKDIVLPALKEQAWYDLGLSQVQQKKWQDALESYEEVLKLNPNNEYAKKMIDQIKKMLEDEQKKNQQQEDEKHKNDQQEKNDSTNKDDNKDDKNDNQDDKEKNEKEESDSQKSDAKNNDKEQDNKENDNKQEQSDQQDEQQKNKDQTDQHKNDQSKQQEDGQREDNEREPGENRESSGAEQEQKSDTREQNNQPKEAEHPANDISHDIKKENNKNSAPANQAPDKETMLLQLAEQHDAQIAKSLFKRQLQQMQSRHGQKNW